MARSSTPVRGSSSGRPIMALLDLLGRRWTLRILWELRDGAQTFRALQAACDQISPSVLNTRLKELTEAKLVTSGDGGYALTALGLELLGLFEPVNRFATRWMKTLTTR